MNRREEMVEKSVNSAFSSNLLSNEMNERSLCSPAFLLHMGKGG